MIKIRERWATIVDQLLKLYLRLNPRSTFYGHPMRGYWGRCIDKNKEKKDTSWIKLKASRHLSDGLKCVCGRLGRYGS